MSKNQISEIPDSIGKLPSLKELWIHENNLESLPESMLNIETLESIQIDGNPIHDDLSSNVKNLLNKLKSRGVEID